MKFEGSTLNFTYDASGTPLTMSIGDAVYYYVTNLQGDVVKLLDGAGNTVAAYNYDAWGVCTGQTLSFVESYNPLRYRGYVYDLETGLYYLQSRYYDPQVGRFLNADVFYSTGQGFFGNNMFAYCGNQPVNNIDPHGMWTLGLSIGGSAFFWLGVSVSIGIFIDDNGNFDVQWSHSVSGTDKTNAVGGIGAGAGLSFQYTNNDTVYDLYGSSTYAGASGGPSWYVGADAISTTGNGDTNGVQVNVGVGVGVDVHIGTSYTESVLPKNRNMQGKTTYQEQVKLKRAQFCYKMNIV